MSAPERRKVVRTVVHERRHIERRGVRTSEVNGVTRETIDMERFTIGRTIVTRTNVVRERMEDGTVRETYASQSIETTSPEETGEDEHVSAR